MRKHTIIIALVFAATCANAQETHLDNITQLTFGGDNAEAYFSPDGKWLSFQSNNKAWGLGCDQIFVMNIDSAANNPAYKPRMISTGRGRTTCAYFMPDGKHVLYASTHEAHTDCPPEPAPRADRKASPTAPDAPRRAARKYDTLAFAHFAVAVEIVS